MWYAIIVTILTGYFLGNLNGAVLISNLIANEDVRTHGSGNAGLTNFIRNYGASRSLLVFLVDGGKAVLGCLAGGFMLQQYGMTFQEGMMLGGVGVMLGHDFPCFLGFKGGKGILSGWFIALTIDWRVGIIIFLVFALAYGLTKFVSLGSVLASATFAIAFPLLHMDSIIMIVGGITMGLLAIWMHRANIVRLVKGQERKTNLFGKGNQ